ncbi:MAG TPA: DUF1841 family protein [Methylophilaceae bacterium]|nr:DUF1841 family protein [Methylophilaceae bacterium]
MALFNPSRDQVRQFFFDAWAKFRQQQPLSPLEAVAVEVIQMHPEYHQVLDEPEQYLEQSYFPEMGETNPFLHLSLHLSILEQVAINQPAGIAGFYKTLLDKHGNALGAQHDLMDCLAEVIWQSQRNDAPLDAQAYLQCMERKAQSA